MEDGEKTHPYFAIALISLPPHSSVCPRVQRVGAGAGHVTPSCFTALLLTLKPSLFAQKPLQSAAAIKMMISIISAVINVFKIDAQHPFWAMLDFRVFFKWSVEPNHQDEKQLCLAGVFIYLKCRLETMNSLNKKPLMATSYSCFP